MNDSNQKKSHPIVFFDGVCGLCNTFVDFTIPRDRNKILRYSPLQGETAQKMGITSQGQSEFNTVQYLKAGKLYQKSTAALKILGDLGGIWKLMLIFLAVPRFLRDAIYDYVARHRYAWFGQKESCRLPTPEERSLFLD